MLDRTLFTATLCAVMGLAGCTQQPPPYTNLPPSERFAAFATDFDAQNNRLASQLQAAIRVSDGKKMGEVQEAKNRLLAEYTRMAFALAKGSDHQDLQVQALTWVVRYNGKNPQAKQAFETIRSRHLDSPLIGDAIGELFDNESLQQLLDQSPHADVRGTATYFLAIRETDDDKKESLLALVERDHSQATYRGRLLGDLVKLPLKILRNLRVGKPAMDIVGQDIDGIEFKLSEYRGKVVMLDFWADW